MELVLECLSKRWSPLECVKRTRNGDPREGSILLKAFEVLDLSIEVNSADSLDEVLRLVLSLVGNLMTYDRASIALYDSSSDSLEMRQILLNSDSGQVSQNQGVHVPANESNLLGWSFTH